MTHRKRIAVDFDGVIHSYDKGWQDGSIYGDPISGAIEALEKLRKEFAVFIFTTRAGKQKLEIQSWLQKSGASFWNEIEITDKKEPAIAYIDDRAIRFTNWADIKKYFQ